MWFSREIVFVKSDAHLNGYKREKFEKEKPNRLPICY